MTEQSDKTALQSLFVLGDSISIHYGPFLEAQLKGFCTYERKTAAVTLNLDDGSGANGGDSSMVLDYLAGRLADPAFRPDWLLLNCGLHDIKTDPATGAKQIAPDAYRRNLGQVLAMLAGKPTRLVWVTTTHCVDAIHNTRRPEFHRHDADVTAYNEIAEELLKATGVPVIDLNRFTRNLGTGDELFKDHIHFHPTVSALQAAFVAGALAALIAGSQLETPPSVQKDA